MNLDDFEALVQQRRAIRHFKSDPIPKELMDRLLDIAHWAPSGYNLQPTHFVVADDEAIKEQLFQACMYQRQVKEAPAVVVFTGDRKAIEHNFERVIACELAAGAINPEYEKKLRQFVPLAFEQGPFGLGWLWKFSCAPLLKLKRPIPSMPAVQKRYWLTKQVMLTSMVFMLAASSAGLGTVPMEGFDEQRVRSALNIPRSHIIPLVVPVGYPQDENLKKTRLPVGEFIHHNGWEKKE